MFVSDSNTTTPDVEEPTRKDYLQVSDQSLMANPSRETDGVAILMDKKPELLDPPPPPPLLPNCLVLAILATLCCFMPTGIIAVLKSAEVSQLQRLDLKTEAKKCAEGVYFWIKVSVYIGMPINMFGAVLMLIFVGLHFFKWSSY